MSIQKIAWVLDQHVPDPAMKLILISLANAYNEKSGQCNPGFEQLGRETSLSRSTIIRKLKALEDDRWITSESVFTPSGRQTSNSYRISVDREGVTETPLKGSHGDTHGGVIADTPKEPEERTLSPLTPLTGGIDGLLGKMISIWPQDQLGKRDVAERELLALPADKRQRAADCIKVFLKHCLLRKERVPRLSVYLSGQMFEIVYGAPDLDHLGYYRIHPERPEWAPWLEHISRKLDGEAKAEKCRNDQMILAKTRWPSDLSLAHSVTKMAPSVTEMAPASAARG